MRRSIGWPGLARPSTPFFVEADVKTWLPATSARMTDERHCGSTSRPGSSPQAASKPDPLCNFRHNAVVMGGLHVGTNAIRERSGDDRWQCRRQMQIQLVPRPQSLLTTRRQRRRLPNQLAKEVQQARGAVCRRLARMRRKNPQGRLSRRHFSDRCRDVFPCAGGLAADILSRS
jgi:hypothetical protein